MVDCVTFLEHHHLPRGGGRGGRRREEGEGRGGKGRGRGNQRENKVASSFIPRYSTPPILDYGNEVILKPPNPRPLPQYKGLGTRLDKTTCTGSLIPRPKTGGDEGLGMRLPTACSLVSQSLNTVVKV